jgi:hypothetical protein
MIGNVGRQRVAELEERVDAGAHQEDRLDHRQFRQQGFRRRPHHRVVAGLAFFALVPYFVSACGRNLREVLAHGSVTPSPR